jgi:hypothetical protein
VIGIGVGGEFLRRRELAETVVNNRAGVVTPIAACDPSRSLAKATRKTKYEGCRFQPEIIRQAVRRYLRFTLSLRDVEDLLAERGLVKSYETVRRLVNHSDRRSPGHCASVGSSCVQAGG